jgi:proteasome lid subunit RPN8/RPN11
MSFSTRATIRALVAPDHRLACPAPLWRTLLKELCRRSGGRTESGAFLLGQTFGRRRRVDGVAYYDDLDPESLRTGIVVFDGRGYGPLWTLCRETGRTVVADIHTHPGIARQSGLDRENPMVATPGHVALIVPDFARGRVQISALGIYEYEGAHRWRDLSGARAKRYFYVGLWA